MYPALSMSPGFPDTLSDISTVASNLRKQTSIQWQFCMLQTSIYITSMQLYPLHSYIYIKSIYKNQKNNIYIYIQEHYIYINIYI